MSRRRPGQAPRALLLATLIPPLVDLAFGGVLLPLLALPALMVLPAIWFGPADPPADEGGGDGGGGGGLEPPDRGGPPLGPPLPDATPGGWRRRDHARPSLARTRRREPIEVPRRGPVRVPPARRA
jgi:hypothetical protein